jgi:hypothetical protein
MRNAFLAATTQTLIGKSLNALRNETSAAQSIFRLGGARQGRAIAENPPPFLAL